MKRKGLTSISLAVLTLSFAFMNMTGLKAYAKEDITPLNSLIEVGSQLYVQHDENNNDIYNLKKSETGTTVVYEIILPQFTANKVWTTEGEYIDNTSTKPDGSIMAYGATAPEHYISVKAGEEYFIKIYGAGGSYAPVLFLDDNGTVIGDALTNTVSASKAGVPITVPEKATRMHLTMLYNSGFTLQRVHNLTDAEFDSLTINSSWLEEKLDSTYEQYKKDETLYQNTDKAYITFVNDDAKDDMNKFADLFIEKQLPLVIAAIPENLVENASSQKETRLDVAKRVVQAGGEVMAHNNRVLTQEGLSDYNTMYSIFVRPKQMLTRYGFDVNGIILSDGTGQVVGSGETERWVSSIYSYSDLYGEEYNSGQTSLDSVYYHKRSNLRDYRNDIDRIKNEIDAAIASKSWKVFYFQNANEMSPEVLGEVLDYINSKSKDEVEVITYKEMYKRNAVKESVVKNHKTTYYVSSTGTSVSGTDANAPMSYKTAQSRTYLSGDTILFKRGDTFYGTFSPKIAKIDDSITTISAYGQGEMPNISGYKIVGSKEAWQNHADGIYKIDLTDTQCFSGILTTDANSVNIGFMEDNKGVKYYNKKGSLDELENEYDFYCDATCLYIKSNENPYSSLGELKLATRTNLLFMNSDLKIENIKVSGTGAHGLLKADGSITNVEISNNIIEDIGGSFLNGTTRYGNGIEFYNTDVSNLLVKDNIIRNVYDVGFTIQGTKGSGTDVVVRDNVFVKNTQDSEIWESESATGIHSYEFKSNISIAQGRGWGYEARPDKYVAAHILFWYYRSEDTDIYFHHNIVYHPRRLYFVEQTGGTNIFFKETDYIRSDYNTYLMTKDVPIFRDFFKIGDKDKFISEYGKDENSTFSLIEVDESIINTAAESNTVKTIKKLLREEPDDENVEESDSGNGGNTGGGDGDTQNIGEGANTDTDVGNNQPPNGNASEPVKNQNTVQAGTVFTDAKTGGVYRIVQPGAVNGTVSYIKNSKKSSKNITIPSTVTYNKVTYKVTEVAAKALKGNKKITKITIGKNVRTIGKEAFYGCKNLKTLTIKTKYLTSKNVGKKAFSGIYKKAKIKVPSSKKKAYKKWLRKRGVPSKATIK